MQRFWQRVGVYRPALVAALAVVTATAAGAQEGVLSGRVTTGGGQALPETRIVVLGTTLTTVTNGEGRYSIKFVNGGTFEVRALRVGYIEQKRSISIPAGGSATLDFSMMPSVATLSEVVITATGEQRKAEIGNSVAVIDATVRVAETPIHNMGDLLVAKAPGLSVLPGNMSGTGAQIRIRGLNSVSRSNAPIFIIDGVRMDGTSGNFGVGGSNSSRLNDLSPEEIADIQVVKGPSASTLYGTDAANGVILITTKKGRTGKTHFTYTAERGRITDPNEYWRTYAIWGHAPATPTVQTRCTLPTVAAGTCIKDSVTSANIMTNSALSPVGSGERGLYGMQVSGGSDAVRYFVSGNVESETGPIRLPDADAAYLASQKIDVRPEWENPEFLQRVSVRTNLNATVSPKIDLSVNSSFIKSDQRLPQVDNNVNSFYYNAYTNPGFTQAYTCTSPCAGLGYSGISNIGQPLRGWAQFTPADIFQRYSSEAVKRVLGSVSTNWRPLSWMKNDATIGVDFQSYDNFSICRLNECPNFSTQRQGSVSDRHGVGRILTANAHSSATWVPRTELTLTGTVGADYNNNMAEFSTASSTQLPPGGQTVGAGAVKDASNQQPTATKTLGYFGQVQAGYRDRMFLTGAVRSDQNTAFGTQFKSVVYPSAQLAWVISDERFFPQFDILNQLRLRSAYGSSGVQPGATDALRRFSASTVSLTSDQPALLASAIGNPNLKPEITTEFEAGFESAWLSRRINLDFTWYHKKSRDALINQNIATSVGAPVGSVLRNLGSVLNTGVEASLNAQIVDRRELGWDITVGGSHNRNELITLGLDDAGKPIPTIGTVTRQQEGYALNSFFVQAFTYADANNDGIISVGEVTLGDTGVYVGHALPNDQAFIQNGLDFLNKKVRIVASLDHKSGYTIFNSGGNFLCQQTETCSAKSNPDAPLFDQARAVATTLSNPKTTYGYYETGQFWRLREVSAVLRLPDRIAQQMRSEGGELQLGARNLKIWTKYTGQDPEANYSTGDVQNDFLTTAPRRYFTARINLRY